MKKLLRDLFKSVCVCLTFGFLYLSELKAQENFDPSSFRIDVTHMMPQAYPARPLSYGFFMEVHSDSVQVYLPYMGRVYQPELNDDGLQFDLPYKQFKIEDGRQDSRRISFTVQKSFIQYRFQISVWPNGRADVFLAPSNAQSISYDGDLAGADTTDD